MRIVAGRLGGRRLAAPRDELTRPTSEKVREALFSMLASQGAILGARVLDLYAGTGALGLEALSRGARSATFVEVRAKALAVLRENVRTLGVTHQATILARDAERARTSLGEGEFEVVFADPPYAALERERTRETLASVVGHALAPAGLFVCEHAGKTPPTFVGLALREARAWGGTGVAFFALDAALARPDVADSPALG